MMYNHLFSMALYGVDLNDVDVEINTQMAYNGPVDMVYSGAGHEFVAAPKSIVLRRVRPNGQGEMLLRYEHALPAATSVQDHLPALRWIYAGPAGVFSPAQISELWQAFQANFEAVTHRQFPYARRFLERTPFEEFQKELATKLVVNLGRLVQYTRLDEAIFDLLMDEEPCEDLMFERTRYQALYTKYPCTREEFAMVRKAREKDPVRNAYIQFDPYYESYARSRARLDPSTDHQHFLPDFVQEYAPVILQALQRGVPQSAISKRLGSNLHIHMLHQGAFDVLVEMVCAQASQESAVNQHHDRQRT